MLGLALAFEQVIKVLHAARNYQGDFAFAVNISFSSNCFSILRILVVEY